MSDDTELVVLLDEQGAPCGTADKRTVHHTATPLHLAFSCWLFDDAGRTLLTRRASTKRTWPGIWTNSFCGHPGPDEPMAEAIRRRARDELGLEITDLETVLPDFRYRAVMADGTVENEICPVHWARPVGEPVPNPDEVDELRWVDVTELTTLLEADPDRYSPWMHDELAQLAPRLASARVGE
ncbi:MAG TPA: isopentenyl-diphosphate Delta-isomerase [Segeticoccus sp.]|uniref:isopentenyl-diphosphate Delta-isomerase n=1 Tax=Segeticoccus sp. TaxID=2706531 RepID=UPI002D8107D1|nr:isopentenyl-diphosphate Delta-isomerase [Segeticoccus sp.]HET8600753.1 isopentenyl-diphosphate Delta-isomerase [Segeticoccus sp.]